MDQDSIFHNDIVNRIAEVLIDSDPDTLMLEFKRAFPGVSITYEGDSFYRVVQDKKTLLAP